MGTRFIHDDVESDERIEAADFVVTVNLELSPMIQVREILDAYPIIFRFTPGKNLFLSGHGMAQRIKWLKSEKMNFKWGRDRLGFVALFANKREAMMFKLVWGLVL
jgi:hypothetical protein